MDDAPETLGICRLVVVDSFKAEGGTLPRVRGMWRPARLAADGTLRQMLFPMRTWVVAGVALAALHPRIPSAAAAWALGVEGTALAGEGVVELEEGWRKVGATEGLVCVDWLGWWRAVVVLGRCKPLKTPGGQRKALVNANGWKIAETQQKCECTKSLFLIIYLFGQISGDNTPVYDLPLHNLMQSRWCNTKVIFKTVGKGFF